MFLFCEVPLGSNGKVPNSLLKNNGDGTFTDITISANIYSEHPTQTASWGDYNNDGWIDLFIGNESGGRKSTIPNFIITMAMVLLLKKQKFLILIYLDS